MRLKLTKKYKNIEARQNVTGSCVRVYFGWNTYGEENENASKKSVKKFEALTNSRHWPVTGLQKVKSQFTVKSKKPHPSCVINKGKCLCEEEHIGETEKNVENVRVNHGTVIRTGITCKKISL